MRSAAPAKISCSTASTSIGYFCCKIRFGHFRDFCRRADLDSSLRSFLNVAEIVDFLDVDQIGGRLLQPVLQTDQQIRSAGVHRGAGSVLR